MTITRERQPHHPGRQAHRRTDPWLVKDPTRGYGIFIENMLNVSKSLPLEGKVAACRADG
jgi:hypothetical protein